MGSKFEQDNASDQFLVRGHSLMTSLPQGGGGVSEMMTLYYKAYRVKLMTKGGGGSNFPEKLVTSLMNAPLYIYNKN